jgi:hypothetical protein
MMNKFHYTIELYCIMLFHKKSVLELVKEYSKVTIQVLLRFMLNSPILEVFSVKHRKFRFLFFNKTIWTFFTGTKKEGKEKIKILLSNDTVRLMFFVLNLLAEWRNFFSTVKRWKKQVVNHLRNMWLSPPRIPGGNPIKNCLKKII